MFCNVTLGRKKHEVATPKQYATNVIQWQDITISASREGEEETIADYVLFNQQAVVNALERINLKGERKREKSQSSQMQQRM